MVVSLRFWAVNMKAHGIPMMGTEGFSVKEHVAYWLLEPQKHMQVVHEVLGLIEYFMIQRVRCLRCTVPLLISFLEFMDSVFKWEAIPL